MRRSDPLEWVEVDARKAVLWTAVTVLLLVVYALQFPTQAALVAMILAFAVMIMLHEAGHFLAAKRSGMKVTEFFVGFGPRLWSTTRGETEYGVKAFPLGGYCRIIGMTNLEEIEPDDEPRAYRAKSWHSKVFVAAAGPIVHFVIAIVLMFTVIFFAGDYRNAKGTTTLAGVSHGAAQAGIQPGDQLVSIDRVKVVDWKQVADIVAGTRAAPHHAGDVVTIIVQRGDQVLVKNVTLAESTDSGPKRIVAGLETKVDVPHPGFFAAIALSPREVGGVAVDSVKQLGTVFSPSGISNYFRLLSGDTKKTDTNNRFLSPVGFVQVAHDAVRSGWVDAVGLLLLINVFVGLFNLLPLLPFDGGHIAVATFEKLASLVRGRRVQVDAAKLLPITVAVVMVLGFIFVSSVFLDIAHPVANPF